MRQYLISRDGWLYLVILAVISLLVYWGRPWLVILPGILFLSVLFGLHSDVFVPTDGKNLVAPGDKVRGGENIVGRVSVE